MRCEAPGMSMQDGTGCRLPLYRRCHPGMARVCATHVADPSIPSLATELAAGPGMNPVPRVSHSPACG